MNVDHELPRILTGHLAELTVQVFQDNRPEMQNRNMDLKILS
jgi:hypothetical protein